MRMCGVTKKDTIPRKCHIQYRAYITVRFHVNMSSEYKKVLFIAHKSSKRAFSVCGCGKEVLIGLIIEQS